MVYVFSFNKISWVILFFIAWFSLLQSLVMEVSMCIYMHH